MFVRLVLILVVAAFAVGAIVRSSNGAGTPVVYLVKPADTLWSIAQSRYGGDPREGVWLLERRNHLDGATIIPGEKLVVP